MRKTDRTDQEEDRWNSGGEKWPVLQKKHSAYEFYSWDGCQENKTDIDKTLD